jgi:hypothetical protein
MKRKLTSGRTVSQPKVSRAQSSSPLTGDSGNGVVEPSSLQPFRKALGELFLSNRLSALETHNVAAAAHIEGASSAASLARAGNYGKAPKNLARDIMAQLLKNISMPSLFHWPIPVWNTQTQSQELVSYPFLLPHEMLHHIVSQKGSAYFAIDKENFPALHERFSQVCSQLNLQTKATVALGIHGDGVPFSKKDSIEIISWNFLSHPTADRIPVTAISKQHLCKCNCKGSHTWTAIMEVIVWSLRMLFLGVVSGTLPDGTAWVEPGKDRLACGTQLVCSALLLQFRGDWPFLRSLFYFPSWQSSVICWRFQRWS